jgi:peptidoglycan/LPS O-acetylase OafA/YrhL
MTPKPAARLDALTSLRFVAAMMILVFHTQDGFGRTPTTLNLAQGVSFFYVLSGFILTRVYPRLDGWGAVRSFWRARFARVWPAYVVALALGAWLVGYPWRADTAVAYLAMVQAWIPVPAFFFGYNAVGWSVSTEWFFYLAFPWLVLDLDRTWKWKLAGTFALVLALAALCSMVDMSSSGRVWLPEERFVLNQNGVMYIHPLSRLFEFTCGMCLARAWGRREGAAASIAAATALEAGVVAACYVSLACSLSIEAWIANTLGAPLASWFHAAGSLPAWAALVFVMASGRGLLSRALAWRPLVVLGEISFSIYLVHQILHIAYQSRAHELPAVSDAVAFASYLGLVLLASYVTWRFIEMPARRWIVGGQPHGSSVLTQADAAPRPGLPWRPAVPVLVLAAAVATLGAASAGPATLVAARPVAAVPKVRRSPRSCNLEWAGQVAFTQGVPVSLDTDVVFLRGWFLSEFSSRPGVPAALRVVDPASGAAWSAPITSWTPRPDVSLKQQALGDGPVGIRQRFDLSVLPPGTYGLMIRFEEGGHVYDCDGRRQVVVGG